VGAPFNVYAPGRYLQKNGNEPAAFDNVRTWAYGLSAGDSLNAQWPLHEFEGDNYHLRVYGPNGFFREFKGNAADPGVQIKLKYAMMPNGKKLSGNAELIIENPGKQSLAIEITDNAYKINNHQIIVPADGKLSQLLTLEKSFGWYDVSVKAAESEQFEQRFAGRVETGLSSFSDPLMGRVIV
jgi:phospholipase C